MLSIKIPGNKEFQLKHLVLDFNGTIAKDGKLLAGVAERLEKLADLLKIHIITADTNGSVEKECKGLPVSVQIIGKENQLLEKKNFIKDLSERDVISMGNGMNDEWMFEESDIAVAVLGSEGCALNTLQKGDILVQDINDGLDLLIEKHRLIATLRK